MTPTRHILVTGGAGFIASHLVERLLADGKAVVVLNDLSTGRLENLRAVASHPKLRVVQSKISACAGLQDIVANAEAVYHLAAPVGVDLVVKSHPADRRNARLVAPCKTLLHMQQSFVAGVQDRNVPFRLQYRETNLPVCKDFGRQPTERR